MHGPVQQSRPQSWNEADLKKLPGVITTVKLKQGIAIVADSVEHVLAARETLKAQWKKGATAEGFNSEQELETDLRRTV